MTISSTHYVLTVDTDLTEFETVHVFHDNPFILDPAVKQTDKNCLGENEST